MQHLLLPKGQKAYGGILLKTRKGRSTPRSISTKHSMHIVLRSSLAKGKWSMRQHQLKIKKILNKFCSRYGVKLISMANVGNHLHIQIKLSSRYTYKAFIRGVTSAISMAVTGFNRWNKPPENWKGFWDYRPFSRIIVSYKEYLNLKDYIYINRLEGFGYKRGQAEWIVKKAPRNRAGP